VKQLGADRSAPELEPVAEDAEELRPRPKVPSMRLRDGFGMAPFDGLCHEQQHGT